MVLNAQPKAAYALKAKSDMGGYFLWVVKGRVPRMGSLWAYVVFSVVSNATAKEVASDIRERHPGFVARSVRRTDPVDDFEPGPDAE